MGLGDLIGKASEMLGGDLDIGAKLEELGIDPSMLEGLDLDQAKELLAEKGLDLSMLDGMGLDGILEKFTGGSDS